MGFKDELQQATKNAGGESTASREERLEAQIRQKLKERAKRGYSELDGNYRLDFFGSTSENLKALSRVCVNDGLGLETWINTHGAHMFRVTW